MDFILRRWQETDASGIVKHANNYHIAKFLTDQFPYPYTKKDAEQYIASVKDEDPVKVFAIEINKEVVGSIGIFPQSDIHCKNAEIGYWLSEQYWGKGIMTNAIIEIVDYGFKTFDINRIFAGPFGNNKGSQRVLEKAGFVLEARFKDALYKNGEFIDELIYAKRKDK